MDRAAARLRIPRRDSDKAFLITLLQFQALYELPLQVGAADRVRIYR